MAAFVWSFVVLYRMNCLAAQRTSVWQIEFLSFVFCRGYYGAKSASNTVITRLGIGCFNLGEAHDDNHFCCTAFFIYVLHTVRIAGYKGQLGWGEILRACRDGEWIKRKKSESKLGRMGNLTRLYVEETFTSDGG